MGVKVGRLCRGEGKYISGLSVSDLNELVARGGKDKLKALAELAKRKVS